VPLAVKKKAMTSRKEEDENAFFGYSARPECGPRRPEEYRPLISRLEYGPHRPMCGSPRLKFWVSRLEGCGRAD